MGDATKLLQEVNWYRNNRNDYPRHQAVQEVWNKNKYRERVRGGSRDSLQREVTEHILVGLCG